MDLNLVTLILVVLALFALNIKIHGFKVGFFTSLIFMASVVLIVVLKEKFGMIVYAVLAVLALVAVIFLPRN